MTKAPAADLLATRARALASDMLDKVEGASPVQPVRLPAADFRAIADLLLGLADAMPAPCECMGSPIDGIRFWVPADQLESQRARVRYLEAEVLFRAGA